MKNWNSEVFAAWLGGFFDGEGCIYLNPKAPRSCEISIGCTDEATILRIREITGVGVITKVEFENPNWKPQWSWRVRNYRDSLFVLTMIRPYIFIKARACDAAIARVTAVKDEREARRERNAEIHKLAEQGLKDQEIAMRFGVSRQLIQRIRVGKLCVTDCPKKDSERIRKAAVTQTTKHVAPYMATKTEIVKR